MRDQQIYADPNVEHVLTPGELFDLSTGLGEGTLPLGFIREVGQAASLTDLLDTITAWMQHLLPVDRASISIPDGTGMVKIWALRGDTAAQLDKSLPVDYGRPGRVIRDHVLIMSPHLSRCTLPDGQMLYKAGLRRTVNAPLMFGGRCYGSLNATASRFDALGLREALTLQSLALWLAPAMAGFLQLQQTEVEVQRARELTQRAQSESAMKSSFIANVSHEIRTPLNAILGMAQMLETEDLSLAQAEKVDVVLYSARSLLMVLNDILDLSKIEAGKLNLKPVRQRPEKAFAHVVNLWRDRASERGLVLTLDVDEAMPRRLIYDGPRVQQCVSNLLSNAIKFSKEGTVSIRVSSQCDDAFERVTVRVQDTGPGIAVDDQEIIFEPFRQGQSPQEALIKGTGLGLSISRRLARMMGGDVCLEDTQGRGAVFALTFIAKKASEIDVCDATVSGPSTARPEGRAIAPGTRILLVEDVPTNRIVVRMLLDKFGVILTEAENGAVALDILGTERFDVVLLDMQMPVMDGPETIRRIRATASSAQNIPVIALTASAMAGDRERFLQMGIDGYIPKPVEEADLVAEILAVLR